MNVDSLETAVFKSLLQLDDKRRYLVTWKDFLQVIDLHDLELANKDSRDIFRKCKVENNEIDFSGLRKSTCHSSLSKERMFCAIHAQPPSEELIISLSSIIKTKPQHENVFNNIKFIRGLYTCFELGTYTKEELLNTLALAGFEIPSTLKKMLQKNEFGLTFQDLLIGLADIDPTMLQDNLLLQLGINERKGIGLQAVRHFDEGKINFRTFRNKLLQLGFSDKVTAELLIRSEQTGRASFSQYCKTLSVSKNEECILEEAWIEALRKTGNNTESLESNSTEGDVEISDEELKPNNLLIVLKTSNILEEHRKIRRITEATYITPKDAYLKGLRSNWSF